MLVSVITIFLNGEAFLREAVESVFAQTHDDWELFLVDDGSSDGSTRIAREYAERHPGKVTYLEHEGHANRGMSASRNLGIRRASGKYVAFIDGDDVWMPRKLAEQVAIMEREPSAAMVYGRSLIWHGWTGDPEDCARDGFFPLGVEPDRLIEPPRLLIQLIENRVQTPTTCNVMVRRAVFDRIGLFEESFRTVHEDQAFYSKVHLREPSFVSNAVWAKYRQHPTSSSATAKQKGLRAAARRKYLEWLEGYLASQGVRDERVWQTLNRELRRFRAPRLRARVGPAVKRRLKNALEAAPAPIRKPVRALWTAARPPEPPALVLMYHRIAAPASDPHRLCVSPDHFEEHLRVLSGRANANVLPLASLAEGLDGGDWPKRSVVLTLDDGYVDNLRNAKPLLERYGAPATVFVTTGGLGSEREFWWDRLERLLLRPRRLPETLTLVVEGQTRTWPADGGAAEGDASRRAWHFDEPPATPRQALFQEIHRLVYGLPEREKQTVLDQIEEWAPADGSRTAEDRPLSAQELVELSRAESIEIGAHTVHHPALPTLPIGDQYEEIHRSRMDLERLLGRPVQSFAYPHGEHSADSIAAVEDAGFLRACTTRRRPVTRGLPRFKIPRFAVADCDGETFAGRLERWFEADAVRRA